MRNTGREQPPELCFERREYDKPPPRHDDVPTTQELGGSASRGPVPRRGQRPSGLVSSPPSHSNLLSSRAGGRGGGGAAASGQSWAPGSGHRQTRRAASVALPPPPRPFPPSRSLRPPLTPRGPEAWRHRPSPPPPPPGFRPGHQGHISKLHKGGRLISGTF